MNYTIKMGKGYFVCHNKQEKKVVDRFCRALASESLDEITMTLEPYRKQNEWEEERLNRLEQQRIKNEEN